MCVCGGGGGGGGSGTGRMVKMFNSIFCFFLYYKTIQNRWKIYISITFSCNFGGFRGRGSKPLAPAVVTELKLCKLN